MARHRIFTPWARESELNGYLNAYEARLCTFKKRRMDDVLVKKRFSKLKPYTHGFYRIDEFGYFKVAVVSTRVMIGDNYPMAYKDGYYLHELTIRQAAERVGKYTHCPFERSPVLLTKFCNYITMNYQHDNFKSLRSYFNKEVAEAIKENPELIKDVVGYVQDEVMVSRRTYLNPCDDFKGDPLVNYGRGNKMLVKLFHEGEYAYYIGTREMLYANNEVHIRRPTEAELYYL